MRSFVIRLHIIDYLDIIHIVQKGYAVYFIINNNNNINNFFPFIYRKLSPALQPTRKGGGDLYYRECDERGFQKHTSTAIITGLSSVKTSRKVYNIVMSQYNILINKYYYYSNVIIPAARIHYVINGRTIDHIPIIIYIGTC